MTINAIDLSVSEALTLNDGGAEEGYVEFVNSAASAYSSQPFKIDISQKAFSLRSAQAVHNETRDTENDGEIRGFLRDIVNEYMQFAASFYTE